MGLARRTGPYGVFHRPHVKRARWRLIERAASYEAAWRRMFELLGTMAGSGDWRLDPIDPDGRSLIPEEATGD